MSTSHDFPWHDWSDELFERARREGRPVLLHIGATWCHWCHVMDEGSYTHPGVARLIREHFLAVRVDTDARPDLNERYNQGGWPTFAVLDADGEVLMGRTYVPAGELHLLLMGLASSDGRWSISPERPPERDRAPVEVAAVHLAVTRAFDRYHGGFGDVEKFPHLGVVEWLLDRAARGAEGRELEMLDQTLDAMALRGLHDHVEGGFYRYCTQDDWSVPHYEKLLPDNARLVQLLLRGAALRQRPAWRLAAEGAISWLVGTLWQDRPGAFGGSQDADESWHSSPGPRRGQGPPVDPTVYAGWNGAAVEALVFASAALDRPGLLGLARRVGEGLLERHVAADGQVRRCEGGAEGLLEDQVGVAAGLLSLCSALGEERWFHAARRCLDWAWARLGSPEGGCLDRVPGGVGRLKVARRPLFANAELAGACHRLAALAPAFGEDAPPWLTRAQAAARAALVEGADWGFMAAVAAAAAERASHPPVLVKLRGAPTLLRVVLADPRPGVVGLRVEAGEVPEGHSTACTPTACARPVADEAGLERTLRMLGVPAGAGRVGGG